MSDREYRRPYLAADVPVTASPDARPTLSPAFGRESELRVWMAVNPAAWGTMRAVIDGAAALALVQHRDSGRAA
jgi:hypothetical protein